MRIFSFLSLFLLILVLMPLHAAPLRVGVVTVPPFAMVVEGKPKGIAVDLWKEIVRRGNFQYDFVTFSEKTDEIVNLVHNNKLDVAIGAIAVIPERVKKVDFTNSYFNSKTTLIVHKDTSFLWHAITGFFQSSFLILVFSLISIFLIYVTLHWFFEREKHEEFPKTYFDTVNYFFWSLIINRRISYLPQSLGGKLGSVVWLVFTTFLLASLTASLSSYFFMIIQTNQAGVTSVAELHNKVLTAVEYRHTYGVAKMWGSSVVPAKDFQEALSLLKEGKVFGIVSEYFPAQYQLEHSKDTSSLMVSNLLLDRNAFAFAVRYNDPLRVKINLILSQIDEEDLGSSICAPYLGKDAVECEF